MSDATIDLYERHAETWAADRVDEGLEASWLERFTRGMDPGAQVLDLGCGSGRPLGAALLRRGFCVTGVDASPTLIAMAAQALPEGRWQVGDMRRFAPSHPFEGVLAWHSLFHLSEGDQEAMFPRFSRLCAAGGRLMFTSGSARGIAIGEWCGEPLHHASLDTSDYAQLLERNGFDVIEHRLADPDCGHATVWLARRRW